MGEVLDVSQRLECYFANDYWEEVHEHWNYRPIKKILKPPYNLPYSETSKAIARTLNRGLDFIAANECAGLPVNFQYHPNALPPNSIVLYDVERLISFTERNGYRERTRFDRAGCDMLYGNITASNQQFLDLPSINAIHRCLKDGGNEIKPKLSRSFLTALTHGRVDYERQIGIGLIMPVRAENQVLLAASKIDGDQVTLSYSYPAEHDPAVIGQTTYTEEIGLELKRQNERLLAVYILPGSEDWLEEETSKIKKVPLLGRLGLKLSRSRLQS